MNKQIIKRLAGYTKPYKFTIFFCFLLSIIFVGLSLSAPIIVGKIIDNMIGVGEVDFKKIFTMLIIVAIIYILTSIAQRSLNLITNKMCYKIINNLRNEAFNAITNATVSFSDNNSQGQIINKVINDIDTISDGLLQGIVQLFTGITTIIATLAIMFTINFVIALAVLFLTPISLIVAMILTKNSYRKYKEQADIQGELYGYINEAVEGQKIIKGFNEEKNSIKKFEEINARLNKVGWKAQYYSALTNPSTRFINSLVCVAVGILGGIFCIKSNNFSIGKLSIFLSYANQYNKPFNEISSVITQLSNAVASAERVFCIIDIKRENLKNDLLKIETAKGEFEINNISFSYNDNQKLIENFNLKVKCGDKIAIVGPTGCGKTTFINLLMRFYDYNSGKIFLDGKDISQINLNSYRNLFGMVLQDSFLMNDTVFNNIAYGAEGVQYKDVVSSAKAAYADFFINNLSNGYNTVLDENINISQGEKQLLCIARIMLANPQILILDEATSNIDIRTEQKIQDGFKKIMKGKTAFIVAHRLSTIKDADTIIVMDKGNIVEQGNHESLLAKKSFYYNLYNSQFVE